jgi:predicted small secreted protein
MGWRAVLLTLCIVNSTALRVPRAISETRVRMPGENRHARFNARFAMAALAAGVLASHPLEVFSMPLDTTSLMLAVCDSRGRCTSPPKMQSIEPLSMEKLKREATKANKEAQKQATKLSKEVSKEAKKVVPKDTQKAIAKATKDVQKTAKKVEKGAKVQARKAKTEAAKVVPKDVQKAAKDVQKAAKDVQKAAANGERVRNEKVQKMLGG